MTARGLVPGAALQVLPSSIALLHSQEAVFEAMLAGWSAQQTSRLLAPGTVESREVGRGMSAGGSWLAELVFRLPLTSR